NYTAESYQVFADALVVAKATVINAITDEEVIQASEALATAKEALAKVEIDTDKTALKIAIDMANVITDEDLANVVSAVVDEFIAARDEANAVYNDASASQVEVNNAFDRLASAMQKLEFFKGDKTALKAFIDKVSGLESIKYTETTWTAFETELT
ncbi:FIVAR domain-containing protein, partial [Dietzia sp. Marseille-Q0999]|nr:FIVAR domain-containing protein [Dietzia massiliensis]